MSAERSAALDSRQTAAGKKRRKKKKAEEADGRAGTVSLARATLEIIKTSGPVATSGFLINKSITIFMTRGFVCLRHIVYAWDCYTTGDSDITSLQLCIIVNICLMFIVHVDNVRNTCRVLHKGGLPPLPLGPPSLASFCLCGRRNAENALMWSQEPTWPIVWRSLTIGQVVGYARLPGLL